MLKWYIFLTTPFYLKIKNKIPQVNKLFRWEILSLEALISSFLFCKVAGISIFYFSAFLHFNQFLLDMAHLKKMDIRHVNMFSLWWLILFLCSQNPWKSPVIYFAFFFKFYFIFKLYIIVLDGKENTWATSSFCDIKWFRSSVQFSSVQLLSCVWLCDSMDCSTPGLPVHHQFLELIQTHVHWVSDAIQPSHPLLSPSPPTFNLSQHQGLFKWVSSSHQVAKVLEFQLQHQSFQWIFRTDFLNHWLVWWSCSPRDSQESFPTPQFKSINSSALSLFYGPTLTSIHDHCKNHSLD